MTPRFSATLLEAEHVTVRFGGVTALDDASLRVNAGEIVGLIGPNGAGKTTFFNCVTGVLKPDTGLVTFDGVEVGGLPPHRRSRLGMARTFQNLQLFSGLTALENLMVAVDAHSSRGMLADAFRTPLARFEERRAEERARALLHFLNLSDRADTLAGDLPVGLQRRLDLGRALVGRPRLLLLDEPAAGLDTRETADLAELLVRVRDRFNVTMLLVDHDMALVMRVCDHIYVLDFGKMLTEGAPAEIRQNETVIRAYLGEAVS
ncbi:MAG TPA: ABC transporter ATP-binding protein [Acidimicrobiia bacterium]|nr:ABC transporter ATP-binding protein [Acidimicrobiia bacterium]